MNREIIFRGQVDVDNSNEKGIVIKKNKSWVYGDLIHRPNNVFHIFTYDHRIKGYHNHIVDNQTIGQFTGLKDKNGKEIYEGDWVELPNDGGIGAVLYEYGTFGLACYANGFYGIDSYTAFDHGIYELKNAVVVGNIYDNPDI